MRILSTVTDYYPWLQSSGGEPRKYHGGPPYDGHLAGENVITRALEVHKIRLS
jgi:hypothetical protein